jgi:FkbM family methyltransferase
MQSLKSVIGRTLDRNFPRLWLSYRIWREDRHFEPEFWLIPHLCDCEHVAIDIGANAGEFSYLMARHASHVIAFEPNLDLLSTLQARIPNNVTIYDVALSRSPGVAEFRVIPDNTGIATIEPRNSLQGIADGNTMQTRNVEMRALDSYQIERVSLIKIDVEGHEEAVLDGAVETLRRNRPTLIVESENRHNPGAPARIAHKLQGLGYQAFFMDRGRFCAINDEILQTGVPISSSGRPIYNYVFFPTERTPTELDVITSGLPKHLRR